MKRIFSFIVCSALLIALPGYAQLLNKSVSDPTIYDGSTDVKEVYSPALEGNLQGNSSTRPVKVYLPSHYENFPENRYPVLYLLHHYMMDHNLYFSNYNIAEKLDQLISQKVITPMIVVTPNAKTEYDGSWYTNSYVSGNWEDYLTSDVIQHMANHYHVLDERESRGMAGFGDAGFGTMNIAMKHPSAVGSIATMLIASADMESLFSDESWRNEVIDAAKIAEYREGDPWYIHAAFSQAVAFAPDSSVTPILGSLPFTAEGVLIDSIKQKWMEHDPLSNLDIYKDSLLRLNEIRLYNSKQSGADPDGNESFHQAMTNLGIAHDYVEYDGIDPTLVLDSLLSFFSESLVSIVPTISVQEGSHYVADTLVVTSDKNGSVYFVSNTVYPAIDSILKYQLINTDVIAGEENEIDVSDLDTGYYHVYAVSNENMVSNIPVEFCRAPDTPIAVYLKQDTVPKGDSLRISLSRNGTVCLIGPAVGMDTFLTVSEILASSRLKSSVYVPAGEEAALSTSSLATTTYWIYGYDQYGIVSAPVSVEIVEPTAIMAEKQPEIDLYPNPAFETVMLQVNITQPYDLIITSLNGQQVYSRKIESAHHQLDLSSFQKGIYFITIRSQDFVTTKKIIKM